MDDIKDDVKEETEAASAVATARVKTGEAKVKEAKAKREAAAENNPEIKARRAALGQLDAGDSATAPKRAALAKEIKDLEANDPVIKNLDDFINGWPDAKKKIEDGGKNQC